MIHFKLCVFLLAFGLLNTLNSLAQTYKVDNENSTLTISGTSSLHDWTITAEQQEGTINLTQSETIAITSLAVSFDVNALKSGKSGMDKNTRKALNYKQYKTIDLKLGKVTSVTKNNSGYAIVAKANLTIAGTTKPIDLSLQLTQTETAIILSGKKELKMTTFNVDPPKALLGTITTGDAITIEFETTFK